MALDEPGTIELLRRARAGDRPALERLLARCVPRLRRWAAGRLPGWARDVADTDDMIQDALIRTVGRLETFEAHGDGALHAYLCQALRNRVADELRKAGRRPPLDSLDETQQAQLASPLEEAVGREAIESYERALGRLDEAEREAVVARVELGQSYEEIARTLAKPSADAARMAVSRALVRLAREMNRGA